ncbi:hypothetical protein GCM10009846_25630 [Agrococcus versicolor]|uniref:LPXTG cell wall anchor domain-containing protein n=1 Tax=Agrococcus versicolor TaxID=501482 RepID=A0ABP5MRT0_9MICO
MAGVHLGRHRLGRVRHLHGPSHLARAAGGVSGLGRERGERRPGAIPGAARRVRKPSLDCTHASLGLRIRARTGDGGLERRIRAVRGSERLLERGGAMDSVVIAHGVLSALMLIVLVGALLVGARERARRPSWED